MTGLAEEMGKQFEEQQALIRDLQHQVERLRHFEQVHIDNLDHYREQIAAIETDNELYERAIEAAYDAGRNRDGTPPDEWTLGKAIDVVDAYLAIAPQADDGKDALIRDLVTMIGQALADTERSPLEIGFNHSSETARELARGQLLVRNGLFDALAKAKAAGYEP